MKLIALALFAGASLLLAEAPLSELIKSGRRSAALEMIAKKSADVNAAEADGTTPLLWAATRNDVDLVARLLKAGAKPNVKNSLGTCPLAEAAVNANTEIVKSLLNAGADPNVMGPDGQTPLMLVARTANLDAAKLLLEKGANVNARESQRGQTALMWAAASSQAAMMRELVAHGAEVNAQSNPDMMIRLVTPEPRAVPLSAGGMTPLLFSAREGCMECTKALVENGAQLDLTDPEAVSPLILAVFNARFDVAKYLVEKGANVNHWDWWGRTALYLAVDYNTLPHGERADAPSLDETLPIDLIKILLEKGANPNLQLKLFPPYRSRSSDRGLDNLLTAGTTPLLRAAKAQDAPAINLLLEYGALIDLPTSEGMTPTVAASGMGSVDADTRGYYHTPDVQDRAIASLDLLLSHGGAVNGRAGKLAQAPLHGAAFWGWERVVEYLLGKGAEINLPDSRGYTAVDYAMGRAAGNSRGGQRVDVHKETADFLIAKGGVAGKVQPAAPVRAETASPQLDEGRLARLAKTLCGGRNLSPDDYQLCMTIQDPIPFDLSGSCPGRGLTFVQNIQLRRQTNAIDIGNGEA